MKKLNYLHCFLLFTAITVITACQKENHEKILSTEDLPSVSENVVVPETMDITASRLSHSENKDYNTFYGPVVHMGNGHIRSWINITKGHKKEPLAIGIEISHKSLQNLPADPTNFPANTFILKLHHKAQLITPFDHIVVNWEPEGHEPAGIYEVPHFDMHFYKISLQEQFAITGIPGPLPPSGYLPASYVIQGATVPQMGTHWLDPSSPELPPTSAPFTHTFIYGSNNGQVHFLEPMITREFLLCGNDVCKAIPQPIYFSPAHTYYPTVYKIWQGHENRKHYVALTDFVWR